jgi:translation initiation factor IF-1
MTESEKKDDAIAESKKEVTFEGIVKQELSNARLLVELDTGNKVVVHVAEHMRKNFIRVNPGDRVCVELSPYDLTKGRIVYRERSSSPGDLEVCVESPSQPHSEMSTLPLYFDISEFSDYDIANILAHLSDCYHDLGGDRLLIDSISIVNVEEV